MTRTTRKSFAKKLIIMLTAALTAFVLALQLVSVPTFISAPGQSGASADTMNGVSVTYQDAPNGLDPGVKSVSDTAVENAAKNESTPKPDEKVDVIITFDGTPMMDYASERGMSVSDAANSAEGRKHLSELDSVREKALGSISKYITETRLTYTTITNGISATVRYADIEAIERNRYVSSVIVSDTYLAPQAVTENYVDVYESGIFNSSGIGYDGTGTVVAVVDTGTDYTHEVFDMELDAQTLAITKDDVAAVVPLLTATSQSSAENDEINEDDLYIKTKLPFAYDYADSDPNVYPHNSHGTHVAGIIAGKSEVITGVAPGAQIATFKVFSDYRDGANTEWILAGLNDAVALGVDAINMSLGTSCGFSREVDEKEINDIYDRINEAGICLVVAASNDYSSAQGSTWGNTNLATNPDSGTVGSPASYDASLAVASVSGIKTKYFTVDGKEIYFNESRLVGKTDPNDFVEGLLGDKAEGEYDYVVVPGVGMPVNYSNIDVTGKIAVVRRGTTNFEEKVRVASEHGAVGVIVYNNVSGTISMSVGTKLVIPSCFVTMDNAEEMVQKGTGKVKLSKEFLAGPFMSDFSSWGVLPNLKLTPDITAHGGEIYSAVAGGDVYDRYSGTSMAAPNLAGALILVRQFVKQEHPEYTTNQVRDESYARMMSTSTIVRNEEGNPYSPRKQGSGLANLAGSINTKAYMTVDGSNKPKLSLGDDPQKTGKYTLDFNLVNASDTAVSYDLDAYVMTESMSSDDRTVAEKAYLFNDAAKSYSARAVTGNAKINGNTLSVSGHGVAAVTVVIELSSADKEYLDGLFRNGMYVEGYVTLESNEKDGVDLSLPYLAFYGDWSAAPMLDVSAYEVGASEVDDSVLAEDKLKADQYGTLPYSGWASSTATDGIAYWGMGKFCYMPPAGYPDEQPAQEKYAALTANPDGDYLFYMVSAGLLRGAKRVEMGIRNSVTGELIWSGTDYNSRKAHANGGTQVGGMVMLELDIRELDLPNNSKYTFTMECFLDWEDPDHADSDDLALKYHYGNNNKFSFEFTVDNEKPELSDVSVRRTKSGSSYRYYLDLSIYDNHYLQGFSVSTYKTVHKDEATGNDYFDEGYASITGGVIPVDGNFNSDTTLTVDITSYWSKIQENGGQIYVTCMDYAKNFSSITAEIKEETDLRIEKKRTASDAYTVRPNDRLDLLEFITVKANTLDGVAEGDKAYVEGYWTKDLIWESSDSGVVTVQDGLITGIKAGTATVTVRTPLTEAFDAEDNLHCLKFDITVAGEPTQITSPTGVELTAESLILERGEEAEISIKGFKPYDYPNQQSIEIEWSSTSPNVSIIDYDVKGDGRTVRIRALESGSATIRATVKNSRVAGYCSVRVQQEYLMTNNIYLRSYTGRGDENGVVEIPDDMGIVYIYPQAFAGNEYIKKVIIPEGVTSIMRLAFANCDNLEEVVLPSTLETIEIAAFANTDNLTKINLGNVKTIGEQAFWHSGVSEIDLSSCTYIDSFAFVYCRNLKNIDLTRVGIVGGGAFAHCQGLESVTIPANTSMDSQVYRDGGVFSGCLHLKKVTIYSDNVGYRAFRDCTALESVTFMSDVKIIDDEAFYGCSSLQSVTFNGEVYEIGFRSFFGCKLIDVKLPAGLTILGEQAFAFNGNVTYDDNYSPASFSNPTIRTVTISSGAKLTNIDSGVFLYSQLVSYTVEDGNKYLSSIDGVLFDKAQKRLILYPAMKNTNNTYNVPSTVTTIGSGAFSFVGVGSSNGLRTVNLNNTEYIESYAFNGSEIVAFINYQNVKYIGERAFANTTLQEYPISSVTDHIGSYAFYNCTVSQRELILNGNISLIGDCAFARSNVVSVIFDNLKVDYLGQSLFAGCVNLGSANLGDFDRISDNMFGVYSYPDHIDDDGKIVYNYYYCDKLTEIVIPETVVSLGYAAFRGSALSNVTIPATSKLTSIAGYAFADTQITSIAIPSSVTSIGASAFENTALAGELDLGNVTSVGNNAFANTAVTSVSMAKLVTLGSGAFKDCKQLVSVSMPQVKVIGAEAFDGSKNLSSVAVANAESIGDRAFAGTAVTSLMLDNALSIGDNAFDGAQALAAVSLGKVKAIGVNAFAGTAITALNLPASVENISDGAFAGAESLSSVNIAEGSKYFSQDGVVYLRNENDFYILIGYPAGKTDSSYSVLDRTIKLGAYSFGGNKHLTSLTLPVYMQVIGASAMSGMTGLSELTIFAATAPTLESTGKYREWEVEVDREQTDEYGDPNGTFRKVKYTRHEYENAYDNFGFTWADKDKEHTFTVNIPANGVGYDNRIWKAYVGKYLVKSDKIHATLATLNLIERIKALPQNPTAADANEINTLARLYNILNAAQRTIVNGGEYSYTNQSQSVDGDYYKALLKGVNYRDVLTQAQSKLPSASLSVAVADAPESFTQAESANTLNIVLAVLCACVAAIGIVLVSATLINKRRDR